MTDNCANRGDGNNRPRFAVSRSFVFVMSGPVEFGINGVVKALKLTFQAEGELKKNRCHSQINLTDKDCLNDDPSLLGSRTHRAVDLDSELTGYCSDPMYLS
jgi:hypothetical protein